ncbi:unnamed protein product [Lota lota]
MNTLQIRSGGLRDYGGGLRHDGGGLRDDGGGVVKVLNVYLIQQLSLTTSNLMLLSVSDICETCWSSESSTKSEHKVEPGEVWAGPFVIGKK